MTRTIQQLPTHVANQIAAGEVVQGPDAVLKELLENSLDAGATQIDVYTEDGGKALIRVVDNGVGMAPEDARRSILRHATSKISKIEDLNQLKTLGFRGEALAAISSVAHTTLRTRTDASQWGVCLVIEGEATSSETPVQMPVGTDIAVRNLFFNTPARRVFLKKTATENKHLLTLFQRMALAYPAVSFRYYRSEKKVYDLPATTLENRIVHLMGKAYQQELIPCAAATGSLEIKGYLGTPKQAKKTAGNHFFFVNGRPIKSTYFHHAVKQAFVGLIPEKAHPFYVIQFIVDPQRVDVNVHPNKWAVKFEEERPVYALLLSAVKNSLATYHLFPSIDFTQDINDPLAKIMHAAQRTRPAKSAGHLSKKKEETAYEAFNMQVQQLESESYGDLASTQMRLFEGTRLESAANQASLNTKHLLGDKGAKSADKPMPYMVHHAGLILTVVKSGLLLVDLEAAYQQIWYHRLKEADQQPKATQKKLFPKAIQVTQQELSLLKDAAATFSKWGFELVFSGENQQVHLTAIPEDFENVREKIIVEDLIDLLEQRERYSLETTQPSERMLQRSARRMGYHASKRKPTSDQIEKIIQELFHYTQERLAFTGKPIWKVLSTTDLKKLI